MKDLVWFLGLLVQFGFSRGLESCRDENRLPPWVNCDYGCCGDYPYHTCCNWSDGATVGVVLGGVAFIALIITVCCCLICKCQQTGKSGRATTPVLTVRPAVNPSVSGYSSQPGYPPQPGNPLQSANPYQGHTNQGYNNHISHPPPPPPANNQLAFDPPPYGIQPSAPAFPTNGSTSFAADEKQHGFEHPPHPQAVNNDLVTEYYH